MTVEKPKLYYGSTGKQVFKILRILLLYIHWREKKKKIELQTSYFFTFVSPALCLGDRFC